MTNKQISQASDLLLQSDFSLHCVFRDQQDQDDVGIDYEVEILNEKDQGAAFIFKIQLKGTASAVYDKDGNFIFSDASVARFNYYLKSLEIPTIFVVSDVILKKCFWLRVQGNKVIEKALEDAVAKNQKNFTIRFPESKTIKNNQDCGASIIEAVEAASDSITLRKLRKITASSLREHMLDGGGAVNVEKQFRFLAGVAANEDIRNMIQSGDFDTAARKSMEIFESASESPGIRILGGISLVHSFNASERRKGSSNAPIEAAKFKLGVASSMIGVCRTRKCETKIKRYVRIYVRSARMHMYGRSAMALAISENTQQLMGGTMAGPLLQIQRIGISGKIEHDFFKLCSSMYRLADGSYFDIMPYAWAEMAEGILPFVSSLRVSNRSDLATGFVESLSEMLPFCIQVVRGLKDSQDIVDELTSIGLRYITLADAAVPEETARFLEHYLELLIGDPSFDCLDEVQARLSKLVDGIVGTDPTVKEPPSMEELRAYFAQQAAELGIDLNDPDDKISQIVRIGIEDLDPTRVSRNCEFIHVMVDSYGLPAEMLGLRTAGTKKIVCLKHGHGAGSLKLDSAYETFSKRFPWNTGGICCEDCPDKKPHAEEWSWTDEWHKAQTKRYKKFSKSEQPKDGEEGSLS